MSDPRRPKRSQGPLFYLVVNNGDNDAFKPDPVPEIVRLLRTAATALEHEHPETGTLIDKNGNRVGMFHLRKEGVQ